MSAENTEKQNLHVQNHERNLCITFDGGQHRRFVTEDTTTDITFNSQPSRELSLTQEDTSPLPAQGNNEGPSITGRQKHLNRTPCRFFLAGQCRAGLSCSFLHPAQSIVRHRRSLGPCRHFNSPFGCRFGDQCKFVHMIVKQDDTRIRKRYSETSKSNTSNRPVCRHFISTGCMLKEKCRFRHPGPEDGGPAVQVAERSAERVKATPRLRTVVKRPQSEFSLKSLTDEEIEDLRHGEIVYLQKRYPKTESVLHPKTNEESHKIRFVPSDPDWPYDVKAVELVLYFPKEYPEKEMEVSLPQDGPLPDSVRRSVSFAIEDWLNERFSMLETKGRIELVLRAFLLWLERNIEDIFTDALKQYKRELVAKASGIEFIPVRHLQAKYKEQEVVADSSGDEDVQVEETRRADAEDIKPWGEMQDEKKLPSAPTGLDSSRKGTELAVKGLQLYDSVGTLSPLAIKIVIRCQRCKTNEDVTTPPDRVNSVVCRHCHSEQLVKFRHSLLHSFSSLLGYLDLNGCAVVDVILYDCDFKASCMRCDREQRIGGLPPGQVKVAWCESCHAKMSVRVESNQLTVLKPAEVQVKSGNSVHKVETTKVIKAVNDPAIQEGKPLPNQGTCKHYAKSYRWLRFPCCGKAYPCDLCHDNAEGDHEMKYANRMICGFCGKEQPYSADRPCVSCGNNVTRKASEHWEGGKGCRDKIKMSRNDDKKYASSKKTVSKHAQLNAQQGKKVTKLRHA